MRQPSGIERFSTQAVLIVAAWTLVAAVFAAHNMLTYAADGRSVPVAHTVWWSVAEWYTWMALTPAVVWLARRCRLERGQLIRHAAALVVLGVVVAVGQIVLEYAADRAAVAVMNDPGVSVRVWLADGAQGAALELQYLMPRKIGFSYVVFWAIVLATHTVDFHRLYRDRELRTAQLEGALATAQLRALEAQIQPHFLFNTLNAIASLIPDDPAAAEEMVESLSDLLRVALRNGTAHEVPLAEELALIEQYLHIQQRRLADRLRVTRAIEPGALDALVPPLVLQPLVENAIRHGISPRSGGGIVALSAHLDGDTLVIAIDDDGPGLAPGGTGHPPGGVGIANTRARLERLYGTGATLNLENGERRGARAIVRMPFRRTGCTPVRDAVS